MKKYKFHNSLFSLILLYILTCFLILPAFVYSQAGSRAGIGTGATKGSSTNMCEQTLTCANGKSFSCDLIADPKTGQACVWRKFPGLFLHCTGWNKLGEKVTVRESCKGIRSGADLSKSQSGRSSAPFRRNVK